MNPEKIKEFEEEIKKLSITDLTNQEILKNLTDLLILIGDVFAIIKVPRNKETLLNNSKIRQAKDIAIQKRNEKEKK